MIKMKKLTALTICTIMCLSMLFTGCGKTSKDESNEPSKEPVELLWYTIGTPQNDIVKVNDEVNKYIKDKIGATVKIKQIDWGDYDKNMQVKINSGEQFDICYTCSWANDYLTNARKGAFVQLNDSKNNLLEKQGKDAYNAIDPGFWEGAKIDGKIYAIPANKELGVAPSWVFTKEYVDKYKIDITKIKKLEDLEPYLKIIKEKEPGVIPFYTDGFSPIFGRDDFVDFVGVSTNDDSLKVSNVFETEETKETLKIMHRWYKLGYINVDAATITSADNKVKRFVSKADGQPYADKLWSQNYGYEVVSTPIMSTTITNGSTTGSMQAISITSKHPDKAMEFLNLLNTDEKLRNLVNYGIEGTHYEKVEDKVIKLLPAHKDYEMAYFSLGNLFITYTTDNEPKTKWEEFKKFNKESVKSPALGFKFDATSVSTEVAAFKNIRDEFARSLYSGTVDPDEVLPKVNKKLKAAGLDKVMAESQKQLDEWKKSKK